MKKWLVLTLKQRIVYDSFANMLMAKLMNEYEVPIKEGKMYIELKDWNDNDKGQIIIEMEASPEEIAMWTKKTIRERIGMGLARMAIKIDVVDD